MPIAYVVHANADKDFVQNQLVRALPVLGFDRWLSAGHLSGNAGQPIGNVALAMAAALRRGLVTRSGDHITPTPLGLDFLNELTGLFLPEPAHGPVAAVLGLAEEAASRGI